MTCRSSVGERWRTDQRPVQCGVGLGELAAQLSGGLFGRLGGVTGGDEVGTQVVVGLLARPDETPQPLDLGAQQDDLGGGVDHRRRVYTGVLGTRT